MLKLTLAALAGLVAAVLAAGVASALAQEASEVRISARRLADGRVEFALQQRAGRGWSERVLPSSRYFPRSAATGRWLNSSPVLGDARISARRLADGRIEFALQQRAGGGWGERVLPASRYFPANAAVGRWLNSSPVQIGAAMMTPGAAPECSLANHIDRVLAATFEARTASGRGTAFYIGSGEWLTNHHVVEDAERLTLIHGGERLSAVVVRSLPGYDLALLRAQPPASVRPLRLAASRPAVLASVAAVGFPSGIRSTPSATRGVVSKHAPFSHFPLLDGRGVVLQTDAEINPGNSGGPIVDGCGDVVGVATFKYFSSQDGRDLDGIGFGIAAETVTANLAALGSTARAAEAPEAPAPPDAPRPLLKVTAFCTFAPPEKGRGAVLPPEEECRDMPVDRHLDYWWVYFSDFGDWDDYYYIFNGEDRFEAWEMWARLLALPSGCHEIALIAIIDGDEVWSEPYPFCVESAPPPRITAFCTYAEDEHTELTDAECRDRSVNMDDRYSWSIRGIGVNGDNVLYRFNGEDGFHRSELWRRLYALPSGCHEIAAAAAGVWSEPYRFCVEAYTPKINAFCTFAYDDPKPTEDECRDRPVDRNLNGWHWHIWSDGVIDWDEMLYRLNGGDGFPGSEMGTRLLALPTGCHEIAIANVSARLWSAPHRFCVEALTPRIAAFCTFAKDEPWPTEDECRDMPVDRDASEGGDLYSWDLPARGVIDSDELLYRINGGDRFEPWEMWERLFALPTGCHEIAIANVSAPGVWSDPHRFCVESFRPKVIAFCTYAPDDEPTWEECRDRPVNRDIGIWSLRSVGDIDWDDLLLYRFNGGDEFESSEMWDRLFALPSGCHEIAIANVGAPGLWSAPHRFCLAE